MEDKANKKYLGDNLIFQKLLEIKKVLSSLKLDQLK